MLFRVTGIATAVNAFDEPIDPPELVFADAAFPAWYFREMMLTASQIEILIVGEKLPALLNCR